MAKKITDDQNTSAQTKSGFTHPDFDPMANDQIKQAWDERTQNNAKNPGEFTDPNNYKNTYLGYLNQYENRDPFSYDFNSDALYQQYKDQYIQQGQMAMMDTMGQAAAMTGGYGNSYAQTVGQQAYNQQLSQLNEIMPELYGMAYDRYNQEGQDLLNMYNAYLGLYQNDYGMHQDALNNWYKEDARLTDNYNTLYNQGWEEYLLGYNSAENEYYTTRNEEFTSSESEKDRLWKTEEAEKDRVHQTTENEKSRNFTASENEKDRAAAVAKAAATSPYSTLNTEDTMKWINMFEKAPDLKTLENYATALQGIIGPEAAAIWYDTYANKFKDKDKTEDGVIITPAPGNGGRYVSMPY